MKTWSDTKNANSIFAFNYSTRENGVWLVIVSVVPKVFRIIIIIIIDEESRCVCVSASQIPNRAARAINIITTRRRAV